MPNWWTPIIDAVHDALDTNWNTNKDTIDNTLPDVSHIYKTYQHFLQDVYVGEIYPLEEYVIEHHTTGDLLQHAFFFGTSITIADDDPSDSTGQDALFTYMTAMMQSVITGTGATGKWNLDSNVDLVIPVRTIFTEVALEEGPTMIRGGTVVWQAPFETSA